MNLNEYLSSEDAMSVSQLAEAIGLDGKERDQQVRQWRHGYQGRRPNPEYCVAIERATANRVMRWDLRPDDWHRIWPELVGVDGSPTVSEAKAA